MPREYKRFSLDDYEISQNGDIINKRTGRVLKGQKNGKGYLRVTIGKKFMFIHRLVAEKYVPNPNNFPQVNHKDGNKLNNSADNLEWVSNKQNRQHAVENGLHLSGELCPWSKLTSIQVDFIRNHSELKAEELAKIFGVSRQTINDIRTNRTWKR